MLIPSIQVNAPLVVKVVDEQGTTPNPDNPDEAVLYDFSQNWPNLGGFPGDGNAYVAGKLDSAKDPCNEGKVRPPCRAVFWNLANRLKIGAEVTVYWKDKEYSYVVTAVCNMAVGDIEPLLKKTETPRLTIVTAGGLFDPESGYGSLNVAIAEPAGSQAACPEGTSDGLAPPSRKVSSTPQPTP